MQSSVNIECLLLTGSSAFILELPFWGLFASQGLPGITCGLRMWIGSVQFSRSVMSDSLRPHESQHARPPCPSPTSKFTQIHVHHGLSLWRGRLSQDTRPSENSWPQGVLISEHSPEDPHLNPRPSITQLPAAPSAGRLTRTTSKTGTWTQSSAGRRPTDTPEHITSHSPAYQREKTHLLISSHKCWVSKCKAFYSVNLKAYFQE